MDAREFFEGAMEPDFPDEINLQMVSNNPDPERTISYDAVAKIADQVHDFLLARIKGHWKRTGQAPKSLFANLKLTVGAPPIPEDLLEMNGKPWSSWTDSDPEGLMVIDAELRADAMRRRN